MITGLLGIFLLLLGLLAFVFWIWMLIDAIKNPKLSIVQKIVWLLVIFFLPALGAILYFLVGRTR
jgi:hypothetical protein